MAKPNVPISITDMKFSIEDIEDFLRGAPPDQKLSIEYPAKYVQLGNGEKAIIRQAKLEDAPAVLETLKVLIDHKYDRDFYHLVGVRTYSEVLAWTQNRIKDSRMLVATNESGELMALVNWRMWNAQIAISLHTMTFKRKAGLGIAAYAAKIEDAFDYLSSQEWWATFESPFGFRMGFRFVHDQKPWPEMQHELGGSRIYYLTKDHWDRIVKPKLMQRGTFGERPVSKEALAATYPLKPTETLEIDL
ncbi:MAG: N-acetyltransferase [Nitrososphaerota archaeon]|nr:N-acetyltransferase [Nitrososphaerota archaeon]